MKRSFTLPTLLFSFFSACSFWSSGQGITNSAIPNIIPPSPTAAALEKYGQIPVSTYTGVPNISVPLYEVKVRDLTIPISLSYHAGGFRVTEEASWVGLGWSLQAGGVLTHTTRNLDDLYYFVPQNGHAPIGMPDCTPENSQDFSDFSGDPYAGANTLMFGLGGAYVGPELSTFVHGVGLPYTRDGVYEDLQVDWEPDDFRFTMGNYSGAFAFDQQGALHLLEQQKVHISYVKPASGNIVWTIRTPDGFRYEFAAPEVSGSASPDPLRSSSTSAWFLTRIVTPLGEEATFTYERGPNIYNQPGFAQTEIKQQSVQFPATPLSTVYSAGGTIPQYLQRIDFKTGYVLFERDAANRKDLQGGQRLKRIAIYSKDNQLVKRYDLQASYFEPITNPLPGYLTTASGSSTAIDSAKVYEGKRLRLDAVVESDREGLAKPPTRFAYNATPLPVKSSYSVDFWGYYNGVNNTTLIPRYAGLDLTNRSVSYPGADRTPHAATMSACVLKKITYPTGGSNTFAFEPHQYGNVTEEDIQTSTVLATLPFRFRADNVDPANGNIPSTAFTLTESTPITINKYDIWVEQANNKQYTYLYLIDDSTNQPYKYRSAAGGENFDGIWYFPPSTPPNPNDPTNYNTSYTNYYNNPNRVMGAAQFILPAGSYHFEARLPTCNSQNIGQCRAIVEVQGYYSNLQTISAIKAQNLKLLAGGLRVKRIETVDSLNSATTQVQVFNYGEETASGTGTGNGILLTLPIFSKIVKYYYGNDPYYQHQLTSFSKTALSTGAKGSIVGYTQVSVLQGDHGEGGKTVYTYYCRPDRRVLYSDRQANVPSRADELNGSLLDQAEYRSASDGFHLTSRKTNTYESMLDARYHYDLPAVFKGERFFNSNGTGTNKHRLYFYPIPVNWVRLVSTINRQYDPQDENRVMATATRYTYDTLNTGHMQVSQTRTLQSDGSTLLRVTRYPADYTAVTTGPLAEMRSEAVFQHSAIVESLTQLSPPGHEAKTIGGTYTEYTRPSSTSHYLPTTNNSLELAQPTSGLAAAAPSLPPANRYKLEAQLHYDPATANLQQVQKDKNVPTTYVWGYQHTLPLASIQNASVSQVQAALSALGTSEAALAATTDEPQLRTTFQQLRQRLPQARVTSYTYRPLFGVTSQTDPSGRTSTYEYDALGRLLRVRDEQGRILTQQEYHYAAQP